MEVRVKLYVVLVFLCTLTNSYSQDTTEVVRDYTETALRDYAFCKCLEHSQDSVALKSFLHDKDGSAAGYFNVLPIGYEDLMRLAIDNADALVMSSPTVNQRLCNYAQNSGKVILPYSEETYKEELLDLCNSLLSQE